MGTTLEMGSTAQDVMRMSSRFSVVLRRAGRKELRGRRKGREDTVEVRETIYISILGAKSFVPACKGERRYILAFQNVAWPLWNVYFGPPSLRNVHLV